LSIYDPLQKSFPLWKPFIHLPTEGAFVSSDIQSKLEQRHPLKRSPFAIWHPSCVATEPLNPILMDESSPEACLIYMGPHMAI